MNTMRVGAEDGKSLVPVDLAGVGWRRLRCDAIGPLRSRRRPAFSSGGTSHCKLEWFGSIGIRVGSRSSHPLTTPIEGRSHDELSTGIVSLVHALMDIQGFYPLCHGLQPTLLTQP